MTESAHAEAFARLRFKKGQAGAWAQQQSTYFEPFSIASSHRCYQPMVKHQGSYRALEISGILNPFQFPPTGIKRDFRGIHSLFTSQKINEKYKDSRTSRQRRGARKTVGLLAPHRRQGNALHPGQPDFRLWGLESAATFAVGRERPQTHSKTMKRPFAQSRRSLRQHASRAGNQ